MKNVCIILLTSVFIVLILISHSFARIDGIKDLTIVVPSESISKFVNDLLPYKINWGENFSGSFWVKSIDNIKIEKGRISLRRARKVTRYFKQQGINPGCAKRKLLYTSYGANYPIATNEKLSGLTLNRRIQIVVYPKNTSPYVGKKPPKMIFHHW